MFEQSEAKFHSTDAHPTKVTNWALPAGILILLALFWAPIGAWVVHLIGLDLPRCGNVLIWCVIVAIGSPAVYRGIMFMLR